MKEKNTSFLGSMPDWIQALGLVVGFAAAVMSSHFALDNKISVLETKVSAYEKVYDKQLAATEKLADAVSRLTIQVAKLEERTR